MLHGLRKISLLLMTLFFFLTPLILLAETNEENPITLINGLPNPYPAPAISGITRWINTSPIKISDLKGDVVLVHFWSYACVSCLHTIHYLNKWYAKYHDDGLEIIGVQAPVFEFEKNADNVKNAIKKYGIEYPVALDSNLDTWKNYNSSIRPSLYLINKKGDVIYEHTDKGDYDITENNIRYALGLSALSTQNPPEKNYSHLQTPDIQLGHDNIENFFSPEAVKENATGHYTYPEKLPKNGWALRGAWIMSDKKIVAAEAGAKLKIYFHAGQVFAAMGSHTKKPIKLILLLNNKAITENSKDVSNSMLSVTNYALYSLVKFKRPVDGTLELTVTQPGVEIYSITFDS